MAVALGDVWALAWLAYPSTVFCLFTFLSALQWFQPRRPGPGVRRSRRVSTIIVLGQVIALSLVHAIVTSRISIDPGISTAVKDIVVGQIACALVFGVQLSQCLDANIQSFSPLLGSSLLSMFWESFLGCWAIGTRPVSHPMLPGDIANITLASLKALLLIILVGLATPPPSGAGNSRASRAECQPLLLQEPVTASIGHDPSRDDGMAYGTTLDDSPDRDVANSDHERGLPLATGPDDDYKGPDGIARIVECITMLLPFMWPSGIRRLQLRAAGLVLCIVGASWLNVMIPRQLGIIADSSDAVSACVSLCVFILLVLGASESGLGLLKRWLWIPLRAFSTESLTTSAYSHILHLSADFHDSKSTPKMAHVLMSANAFSSLAETALLEAIPALLDVMIAVVYLSISLEPLQGLIIAVVGFAHFYFASLFMAKSADCGRRRKEALYNEISIRHQGLAVWHDSDAIDQLGHEDNRHADAVAARQIADASYRRFWAVSTAVRIAVLISGFGTSTMLAVYKPWKEQSTLGNFIMLVAYWTRLHQTLLPLFIHGTHMGDGLPDAEEFIQLMRTVSTIKNRGNARPLKFSKGDIEFDNVCFEYSPGTPIIKSFSLRISAGQTVAFIESQNADTSVGRHCTGKSTLMKLLRRSYDVTKGSIRIDGQDIRDVHLHSLRQRISLVLPFPVLCDGTIMNNVRYGRITATDEEVYEACKAACIHPKIQSFPDGYNTQVGENGTKLSSSEIQLVGVARAILKIPESGILILDGATSALDEDTESRLQTSISTFCKDLTKLIVTNRVATAMKADLVVVMADGQVLEQGTPDLLFRSGSKHAASFSIHGPVNSNVGDGGPTNNLRANGGLTANNSVAATSDRAAEVVQQSQDVSASKEKSKLNPVAPTFTPRGTRIAVRTDYGSSSSEATNSEGQPRLASSHTSCQWSDEVTAEEERLKSACKPELTDQAPPAVPSLQQDIMVHVNSAGAPRTPCGQMRSKPIALGGPAVNEEPPESHEAPDAISSIKIMQFKRPRYSRRIQSKSEPYHDPVEVGPKLDQVIDEASEPDSSQDSDLPQQRRVSAPAFKSALNKSKIARLARKSQKDIKQTEKENVSSPGVGPDQPSQKSSKKRGEEIGQTPPVGDQVKTNEPAKAKNLGTLPQSQKGPSPLDNMPVAPASRGDHRGGHRGRGSRYPWRRRGARKPSSAVVASAPEARP